MQDIKKMPLVVSEMAGLWNAYMNDSLAISMFRHFLSNVEDVETQTIVQYALNLSEKHIKELKDIFNQEGMTIPHAFNEDDVDMTAPRLYTDSFYLLYLSQMSGYGMESYSLILRYIARPDIRDYFTRCMTEAAGLFNKVIDLRMAKGHLITAPRVEVSKNVSFIEKESFMHGLLREPRPLLAREVTNTFSGILADIMWRALLVGFGQVTRSKQVKDYMMSGKELITKHFDGFCSLLNHEGIPIPSSSESYLTDSTVSPFSDKLMVYHSAALCAFALSVNGACIASSARSDLTAIHMRFLSEDLKAASDAADILIGNGWMEQPPQVVRHENLTTV